MILNRWVEIGIVVLFLAAFAVPGYVTWAYPDQVRAFLKKMYDSDPLFPKFSRAYYEKWVEPPSYLWFLRFMFTSGFALTLLIGIAKVFELFVE